MSSAAAGYESAPTPPFAFQALTKTPPPAAVGGAARRSTKALERGLALLESMRAMRVQMIRYGEQAAADL